MSVDPAAGARPSAGALPEQFSGGAGGRRYTIVIPIFDGVTQLDFTGPYQMLSLWKQADLVLASVGGRDVHTAGMTFTNLAVLEEISSADILLVPGGRNASDQIHDVTLMTAIRRLAATAQYLTSVCTGSLILAAAGLLQGRRAASHWAWRDILAYFGAIPDEARFVRDGNILTGGGVTAGIDFGLSLISEIAGADIAQGIQLYIEYDPNPPFSAGRPDTAPAHVLHAVQEDNDTFIPARRAEFREYARSRHGCLDSGNK